MNLAIRFERNPAITLLCMYAPQQRALQIYENSQTQRNKCADNRSPENSGRYLRPLRARSGIKRSKPVRYAKAALTRFGSVLRGTAAPLRTPLMAAPLRDSSRRAKALWSETRGRSAPRLRRSRCEGYQMEGTSCRCPCHRTPEAGKRIP